MKLPKFRRRDYEDDYAGYDDYDNGYDNVNDMGDDIVEDNENVPAQIFDLVHQLILCHREVPPLMERIIS